MDYNTIRMLSADGYVSACAIDAREIVARAREIHGASPTASAALGRALAIGSLIGGGIKAENGSVTLQFSGDGPGGTLVVVGETDGSVRGCVQNPEADPPRKPSGKLDVGAFIGHEGRLTVIKDLRMRDPYVGTVSLVGGEVAEDVAAYYAESEQIPSAIAAGVLVAGGERIAAAGAYMVQLLPGADDITAARLERNVMAAPSVTEMLRAGITPEGMLARLLEGFEPRVLERSTAEYRCDCSRGRVERALISTGTEVLTEMIDDGKGAEVTCRFCDNVYRFTTDDLKELLKNAR